MSCTRWRSSSGDGPGDGFVLSRKFGVIHRRLSFIDAESGRHEKLREKVMPTVSTCRGAEDVEGNVPALFILHEARPSAGSTESARRRRLSRKWPDVCAVCTEEWGLLDIKPCLHHFLQREIRRVCEGRKRWRSVRVAHFILQNDVLTGYHTRDTRRGGRVPRTSFAGTNKMHTNIKK